MNGTIELTTRVHARLTVQMESRGAALDALDRQGWHVVASGPLVTIWPQVDTTQFEIYAEHEINSDQHQLALVMQLTEALP